jgi:putative MFS transporter
MVAQCDKLFRAVAKRPCGTWAGRPQGGMGANATISARLDRLPAARPVWNLVVLLSLGAFFELYDLLMTGYVSPGLIRAGIFGHDATAFLGLTDQAIFTAVTFAGLFVGTIAFGVVADVFGRRAIFTWSLLWYAATTLVMASRSSAAAIDGWRFIAGVGIGVELVTIDSYISELVPKALRGRAFALNHVVQFCSVPAAALLSWLLLPHRPLGIDGWRYVAAFPALAALLVYFIRLRVPESPRWLAQQGRVAEAEQVTAALEARVAAAIGGPLPAPVPEPEERRVQARFREIWQPPYRRRTVMLMVFNAFQAIGFYGFGNWVPALLASQGASFVHSLSYSFLIALASPSVPLLFMLFADRIERKWQIVIACCGVAVAGILFARQTSPWALVPLGMAITFCNNMLSFSYHAYQSELFPTRIRARAVGFVYSFSRLSTVFTSFIIAFLLGRAGSTGVFGFIGLAMLVCVLSVGLFGPRTRGLALEEIAR